MGDANGVSEPPQSHPAQGEPMALTTDEVTSAPLPRTNGDRPIPEDRQRTTSIGRNPPPVPPALIPGPGRRITSPGGGVQVTLDGKGSWSELARQDATLPTDANCMDGAKQESSGGMFGFLGGKKGRAHSPKPKERGVLGKEGARVVIG